LNILVRTGTGELFQGHRLMAIATCPKCSREFIAPDSIDTPATCPACGERFLFLRGLGQAGNAAAVRQPANIALAAWVTAIIGWLIDAVLATGAVCYLVELAGRLQAGASAARHALSVEPGGWGHALLAACVLFVGLACHAILSGLALASASSRPKQFLLLTRLAAACWLVIGGPAVLLGAHLWPIWLSGQVLGLPHGSLMAGICLGFLAVLMMYLGAMEVCSQRISKAESE
jgi:DNA-directed RNA polymerase subunit RPC12/RpoP